jgi:23S rRNA pseudouridine2605 synthase
VASRRKADEFILAGRVRVNEVIIEEIGTLVEPQDRVYVDGREISAPEAYSVVMLNKPKGFICSQGDPQGRRTIYQLLPDQYQNHKYVGRLDYQTRGLILLSDDGDLIHRLTHPSYELKREYHLRLKEELTSEQMRQIENGIDLDENEHTLPAHVRVKNGRVHLILREGKNREVRRMMNVLGHTVLDLKRVAYGGVLLENLQEGEYRLLSKEEVFTLCQKTDLA